MSEAKVDIFMPLYVGDYMKDTGDLTAEEHGAYLLLLMHMWNRGGFLPADHARLARLASVDSERWSAVWSAISRFFTATSERGADEITQKRLVVELLKAQSRKEKAVARGKAGAAAKHGTEGASSLEQAETKHSTSPSPSPSPSPSESESSAPKKSAETAPPSSPPVLVFPCDGPVKEWHLTQVQIDEWAKLFPALDIVAECRNALAWVLARPERKKTARGMAASLVGWFGRSQNRGAGRAPRAPGGDKPRDPTVGYAPATVTERPSGRVAL